MNDMEKSKALEKIAHDIQRCKVCKKNTSGKAVPGEGNPDAAVMFVGEAPGRKESETGRPFVGRSGQLLTILLSEIGVERKDVYITSPVKYYPGRRAPARKEIEHGKKHLLKQIDIIQPELIILLGNTAIKALLKSKYQVTKIHGRILEEEGQKYFVTFHPAAALRFKKILNLQKSDFSRLNTHIKEIIN